MRHRDQTLNLLRKQVSNAAEVDDIRKTAEAVVQKWVDPLTGGAADINGLIYGLVQSGKTGVLTVTGALGADEGYKTIIILTSDIEPLYEQTLSRAREAFPGMDIVGKKELKDTHSFLQRIKSETCAIVVTKNSSVLKALIENFKVGRVRGLTCLLIDDEADQASLNTRASRNDGSRSTINGLIGDLRSFFHRNTYLQVTATPQALFLQEGKHAFRPKFTVLSHPGADYVGGNDFFAEDSHLVREFPLQDITVLAPGPQPAPTTTIPPSLLRALDTFMVGATYKRTKDADQNCAFLCHVSTRKSDHEHIVDLLRKYKTDLAKDLRTRNPKAIKRLRDAFDDLAATHDELAACDFEELIANIGFLSPGITVKLVNGETDEDVAVHAPYNLFVGGNKLGRGVTIKNLLVSYYGRHPRTPQADTVLQHARMYGYRRRDIGLLRLFLPRELHVVFQAIHKMERSLRDLIAANPNEEFRGIYIENGLNPTRRNVLVPGSIGVYTGGGNYNPAQVLRDSTVATKTARLDRLLASVADRTHVAMPISDIQALLKLTVADERVAERIWDPQAIAESIGQFAKLRDVEVGYVYVDRDRELDKPRRETQGVLTGGEVSKVPDGQLALFLLRTKAQGGQEAAWWPQVRFPSGRYAFAFAV